MFLIMGPRNLLEAVQKRCPDVARSQMLVLHLEPVATATVPREQFPGDALILRQRLADKEIAVKCTQGRPGLNAYIVDKALPGKALALRRNSTSESFASTA